MHKYDTPQNASTYAIEPLWQEILEELRDECELDPSLSDYLQTTLICHPDAATALARILANWLADDTLPRNEFFTLFQLVYRKAPRLTVSFHADVRAIRARDPASTHSWRVFTFYKGFLALQCHRIAHWLWQADRAAYALLLQSRCSVVFGVDIHPGAQVGDGVMFDHASGLVIGETAVIEDNVSILHGVTLGGTGKEAGDRHPKVRQRVLIGAGAQILGNVEIGEGAKIGAGSVVLNDIPAHATAVGVPAEVVGRAESDDPAMSMDHSVNPVRPRVVSRQRR